MTKCGYCGDKAPICNEGVHYCKVCYWQYESNKDRDNGRLVAVIMAIPTIILAIALYFKGC